MPIDVESFIARILTTAPPRTLTAGTLASPASGTTEAVSGMLVIQDQRPAGILSEATDGETALLLIDRASLATITKPAAGYTFTVSGEAAWTVIAVRRRVAHVALELARRIRPGVDV